VTGIANVRHISHVRFLEDFCALEDRQSRAVAQLDTRAAVLAGISQGKTLEQMKQEKAFATWDYLNESHHIQSDVYFERLYKGLAVTLTVARHPSLVPLVIDFWAR
jgi:pimeloyl-CoA synthetase